MHYFRQSLISIPSYIPPPSIADTIGLYSINQIINEPLNDKDRKDLNKIYEQADIFVKRNSIVTINNKKQKKLLTNSISLAQIIPKPLMNREQIQIIGKEGALFQEIHPADVQKTNDDNIFDYRLHMKLAKGDQVFKVQEVKRKQKRRTVPGKQCECCGKQFTRNHKCLHTTCQRKCGKASLKLGDSRKDGSSIWSDSKDENWSQQNYDQQKLAKVKIDKKQGKQGKNHHHHSSSSNRQPLNNGQPSEYLLSSIERLITEKVANNFSYRVIEIKEYQQEDSQQIRSKDESNQMQLEMDLPEMNQDNNPYEENMVTSLNNIQIQKQQLNQNHELYPLRKQQEINLGVNTVVCKQDPETNKQKSSHFVQQQNNQPLEQGQMSQHLIPSTIYDHQNRQDKLQQIQNQHHQIIEEKLEEQMYLQKQQNRKHQNNLQPSLYQTEGQQQQPQQQTQTQPKKQTNHQPSNQTVSKISISSHLNQSNQQRYRSPSSDSEESQIQEAQIEDLPEQAKIPIDQEDEDELPDVKNLQNIDQPVDQSEGSKIQNNEDMIEPIDRVQLPDFRAKQDSLDDQMEEIIQQNQIKFQQKGKQSAPSLKISKKQSKQLKILQKQRLKSDQIQQIDSFPQNQSPQNQSPQNSNIQINELQKYTQHGRGKGRGMGQGKGILEEQLDIYSEDSEMLEQKSQLKEQGQLFQKLQEKPIIKSQLKIASSQPKPISTQPKQISSGPKIISSQPQIQAPLSPSIHGMTPKRRIPNMEKIIQQIKVQSKSIQESKGLGRGKIFGRGLGVLEETEELEKELEEDSLLIVRVVKTEKPKKKVKSEDKIEKTGSGQMLDQEQEVEIVDKFDELIEQEEHQKIQIQIQQRVQDDYDMEEDNQKKECPQSMSYLRYLNKKQTIIEPLQCKEYTSSQENLQPEQDQQKISSLSLSINDQIQDQNNFELQLQQKEINNLHQSQSQIIDFLGQEQPQDNSKSQNDL